MVQYGNAFTVMDLYKLPTYLRLFYYKKLIDSKKKESEQIKNTNKSSKVSFKR